MTSGKKVEGDTKITGIANTIQTDFADCTCFIHIKDGIILLYSSPKSKGEECIIKKRKSVEYKFFPETKSFCRKQDEEEFQPLFGEVKELRIHHHNKDRKVLILLELEKIAKIRFLVDVGDPESPDTS